MGKGIKSSHKKFKKQARDTLYKGIDTRKKKPEPNLSCLERLSCYLNLPADILAGAPILTAMGRNDICLENYKSIIEYDSNIIKIQAKNCRICIEGNHLNIIYFTEDEMRITGYIKSINYI